METKPRGIHYSLLQPVQTPGPLIQEWEVYRSNVEQFLKDGREGQYVLIHGEEILGFFDNHEQGLLEGYRRFLIAKEAFLLHKIVTYEPILRFRAA